MSLSDSLPVRSDDGLAAVDIFYRDFNDVDFYFEDEDQDNLYLMIVKRIFPERRIERVFPLRGKESVIRHAKENSFADGRKSIYILDRDFDLMLGVDHSGGDIFYWDRYCVENHLVEIPALVELAVECCPKLKRADLAGQFQFEELVQVTINILMPLFGLFLMAQKYYPSIPNVGQPVERFCVQGDPSELSVLSVSQYREKLLQLIQANEIQVPIGFPEGDPEYVALMSSDFHSAVSGKHLLKIVFHSMKKKAAMGSVTFESFCYRLAKNCLFHSLNPLRDRINNKLDNPR